MYHWIVRGQIRNAFRQINKGAYEPIVAQFAPDATHIFYGTHALSGSRSTPESIRQWYTRLQTVFPTLQFVINRIIVSGWPWDTSVTATWNDQVTAPDGTVFTNEGVHLFGLRWGKVVSLQVYCDTVVLNKLLTALAAQGVSEAAAAPIEDYQV